MTGANASKKNNYFFSARYCTWRARRRGCCSATRRLPRHFFVPCRNPAGFRVSKGVSVATESVDRLLDEVRHAPIVAADFPGCLRRFLVVVPHGRGTTLDRPDGDPPVGRDRGSPRDAPARSPSSPRKKGVRRRGGAPPPEPHPG